MVAVEISFASTVLPQDVRGRAVGRRLRRQHMVAIDIFLQSTVLPQNIKGGQ